MWEGLAILGPTWLLMVLGHRKHRAGPGERRLIRAAAGLAAAGIVIAAAAGAAFAGLWMNVAYPVFAVLGLAAVLTLHGGGPAPESAEEADG